MLLNQAYIHKLNISDISFSNGSSNILWKTDTMYEEWGSNALWHTQWITYCYNRHFSLLGQYTYVTHIFLCSIEITANMVDGDFFFVT